MSFAARKGHRYLGGADAPNTVSLDDQFELDESEVWSNNETSEKAYYHRRRPVRNHPSRKIANVDDRLAVGPISLPVNIPDWSKILGGEYKRRAAGDWEDEEEDGGNDRIPPHEYLARNRVASFSVHEGVGRTLKGRDLSRVRNAIWKKTGFED